MSRVASSLRVTDNQGLQMGSSDIGTLDASSITASRTFTFQDASYIIVGRDTTETLTNKTLTSPTISSIENSGTLTLPTGTDTIVGRATTDTLTNKTLTSPTISSIENSGTLTLPTGTDTIVGRATTDTLTNKTLTSPTISSIENSGTLTLPTATDTLIGRATTDTLTNKTLTLPTISSIDNSGTLTLPTGTDTIVGRTTTDTLTNKTLTSPVISSIDNGGTLTLPISTDTLVARDTTDTLTNKTLTLPTIASILNGGTVTLPSGTHTLVARTTTDTLTNKTLTGTSNDIEANKLGQGSEAVTVSGSAGLGKVLKATSSSTAVWQDTNLSEIGSVVTTTNATETNIYTLSTDDNTTYMVSASVAGHRTDAGFESVSVVVKCCYKRLSGTNTLVQISADDTVRFNDTDAASWIIASNANTSNGQIEIKVTGQASKTIKWKAILNVTCV